MKLYPQAQNVLERLALTLGLVPVPMAYAHFGFLMSKILLEAVDKGVFEAIGNDSVTLSTICTVCQLNEKAVLSTVRVLATMKLVKERNGFISLTRQSKRWILKDSPHSLYWLMLFDNRVCLKWMDHASEFLKTGRGLQYHQTFTEEEWFYYQKAMEATARATAGNAAGNIAVPKGAQTMLDIGGAHGLYSAALCKKHSKLTSVILDLAPAIEKSRGMLGEQEVAKRVTYQSGDILTDDIPKNSYDVVIMANVAHHFTESENRLVCQKAFEALKPGGMFTILEVLRSDTIDFGGDMLSALGDFFFALSSSSGTWSLQQVKEWYAAAGLAFYKKKTFLTIPGFTAITARKA